MAAIVNSLAGCAEKPGPELLGAQEFGELIEITPKIVVLDVRTPEEFADGHIPHAVNIDMQAPDFVEKTKASIAAGTPVAVYCRSGHRSAEAASILRTNGYNVSELDGGILAWEKACLPVTNGQYDIYTSPNGKSIQIQALIHASIRIIYDGKEIEIDPVGTLGNRSTDYSKFPKADLILVTHEHHDHLDPAAIKQLSKADTIVIANPRSIGILGYGVAMNNGDTKTIGDDIRIETVPAYNTSPDRLQFHPKGRDNGYILSLDGFRIYIAGDTELTPEMKNIKDINVAFMPCNLPYTMTPAQLIEAAEAVKPEVLYPYHYGETDLSSITPALAPHGIFVRILPFDP